MQQATLINHIRATSAQILALIEQAQARAAAQAQEWTKLGGTDFLTDFEYTGMDIGATEVANAMNTITTLMPDILGAHGTNLYKLRD